MVEQLLTRNSADNGGKPCHVFKVCVNGQAVFWFFSYIYKFAVQSRYAGSDINYVHMTVAVQPLSLPTSLPAHLFSLHLPWSHHFFCEAMKSSYDSYYVVVLSDFGHGGIQDLGATSTPHTGTK